VIKLNTPLARSGLDSATSTINAAIRPDIAKYKTLANKLSRSQSGFSAELIEALRAEAAVFEDMAVIYEAIISYLHRACDDLERLDRGLVK